ncbi:hypothetical protein ScPMuIL_012668 [Solemya velum]
MALVRTTVLVCSILTYATASLIAMRYPHLFVTSEVGGNLSIVAGPSGGDVFLVPGRGGSVFVSNTDMLQLMRIVDSLPPIWSEKSPHGSLGTFLGGASIQITLAAEDPEGGHLRFEKVSGAFPPGVTMDTSTGRIHGVAPDVDADYEFGVRVVDQHGKFADQLFSIETREKNQCRSNPCVNGATCEDKIDDYNCLCRPTDGGKNCQYNCANTPIGVAMGDERIPDAQMSGHYSYQDHSASKGRLNGTLGWMGINQNSWLQIDMGSLRSVHAIAAQGYTASEYIIGNYTLQYSADGNTFYSVTPPGLSNATVFTGSLTYSKIMKHTLPSPVKARFMRFIPKSYNSRPGMRVEIYACPLA